MAAASPLESSTGLRNVDVDVSPVKGKGKTQDKAKDKEEKRMAKEAAKVRRASPHLDALT